mgnify:CR=1 FL=1
MPMQPSCESPDRSSRLRLVRRPGAEGGPAMSSAIHAGCRQLAVPGAFFRFR